MEAASLNVYVNTKSLKDRSYAKRVNSKCEKLLEISGKKAEDTYRCVRESFFV